VNLSGASDQGFLAEASINPYAQLDAYGEASVDVVVLDYGVGVNLTLLDLEPQLNVQVQYFPGTKNPYGVTHGEAVNLQADLPVALQTLDGEFYAFVKVIIVGESQVPIADWAGTRKNFDLIHPVNIFLGPVGEFLLNIDGQESTPWTVWTDQTGHNSYQWSGRLALKSGVTYEFDLTNMASVQIYPDDGHSGDSYTWTCACQQKCTQTVSFTRSGNYTLQAATNPECFPSIMAQVIWTETGSSGVDSFTGHALTPSLKPADSLETWYYNAPYASYPDSLDLPVLYQMADEAELHLHAQGSPNAGLVNTPAQGQWFQIIGQVPFDAVSYGETIVFFLEANQPDQACSAQDNIYLAVNDPEGGLIRPLWQVTLDETGKAFVPVQLDCFGRPTFWIFYSSPDSATCSRPPGANLRVAVAPQGSWVYQIVCLDSDGTARWSDKDIQRAGGPANASAGTLSGGSVNSTDCDCANPGDPRFSFQSEYWAGAFDFDTAGDYDFFFGALSFHSYDVWIDGERVASRALHDPYRDPNSYPDSQDCWNHGTYNPSHCPVRESSRVLNLTEGWHLIEALYQYEGQTRSFPYSATTDQSDHLRWDPVKPNQYMTAFYKTQDDLNGLLDKDPVNGYYRPTEALLIVKQDDPDQAGFSLNWVENVHGEKYGTWNDLDGIYNDQVDMEGSMAVLMRCQQSGATEPCDFNILFQGRYELADQSEYAFTSFLSQPALTTALDFRLDRHRYASFQDDPDDPQPTNPLLPGWFIGVLRTSKPWIASKLNDAMLAVSRTGQPCPSGGCENFSRSGPDFPDVVVPPPTVSSTWQQMKSPTDYWAYFWDSKNNLTFLGEDNHGTGTPQSFCVGNDCYAITDPIPARNPPGVVLAASPVADPEGTFFNPSGDMPLDVEAVFQNPGCTNGSDVWFNMTWCINGWCTASPQPIGPGSSCQYKGFPCLSSKEFVSSWEGDAQNPVQGILSKGAYDNLMILEPACGGPELIMDLRYKKHCFSDTAMYLPDGNAYAATATKGVCSFSIPATCTLGGVKASAPSATFDAGTCTGAQDECSFNMKLKLPMLDEKPKTENVTVSDGTTRLTFGLTCSK